MKIQKGMAERWETDPVFQNKSPSPFGNESGEGLMLYRDKNGRKAGVPVLEENWNMRRLKRSSF